MRTPGQLGFRVAGFPGHWVAGSQNVTQFHLWCRRGTPSWRQWPRRGHPHATGDTVSRAKTMNDRRRSAPSARTYTWRRRRRWTWPPASRRGTTRKPTTISTLRRVPTAPSAATTPRCRLVLLVLPVAWSPDVDLGPFSDTQPNIFWPNPAQPAEIITRPNPTHRRHSAIKKLYFRNRH